MGSGETIFTQPFSTCEFSTHMLPATEPPPVRTRSTKRRRGEPTIKESPKLNKALSHPWSFPPLEEWVEQQWQCTRDWLAWLQRRKDKTTAKHPGGWDAGWTLPSSGLPSCVSEGPDQRMPPPPMMTPHPTWYCRNVGSVLSPKSAFLIYSLTQCYAV